jgi:chaperonin GroES
MKLHPLADQILIVPIAQGGTTKGGLLIPDIARKSNPFVFADVHAVGTGRVNAEGKTVPLSVKVGDTVLVARGAGMELPVDDETGERVMTLVQERYVFAVVTDLPYETRIAGINGRFMQMTPSSLAKPDVGYENNEKTELARRAGWLDVNPDGSDDHVDEVEH